ncbi:35145_t:CDS:1, partial [Racocetra persica]
MKYVPVIIDYKYHNLQTITTNSIDTIWTHHSQILPIIHIVYSTLLRISNIQKCYQIHQFAKYLESVYTKCGIDEDEDIILRNCQNFLYTSE